MPNYRDQFRKLIRDPKALAKIGVRDIGKVVPQPGNELMHTVAHYWTEKRFTLSTIISSEGFQQLLRVFGVGEAELMVALARHASGYSHPPISEYPVGVSAMLDDGSIIFGVNYELHSEPLNSTIHGEQFVITRASSLQRGIKKLSLSASPCGHCRQVINELRGSEQIKLHLEGLPANLPFPILLIDDFGPVDLGVAEGALLQHPPVLLREAGKVSVDEDLLEEAHLAAERSYAPYTHAYAGAAVRMNSGDIYAGSYLENVAYNPGITPLHAALVNLIAARAQWAEKPELKRGTFQNIYAEIAAVILAEQPPLSPSDLIAKGRPNFAADSKRIIDRIAPSATLEVVSLELDIAGCPSNFRL